MPVPIQDRVLGTFKSALTGFSVAHPPGDVAGLTTESTRKHTQGPYITLLPALLSLFEQAPLGSNIQSINC